MVVGLLGTGMFLSLGGIVLCAIVQVEPPATLGLVCVGTLGALTGILVQLKAK